MTQKDESPGEASEGPYWSEELLAVLVVGLGDETQARETLEGIIRQALSGRALQGISEEASWRHTSPSSTNALIVRKAFKISGLGPGCRGGGGKALPPAWQENRN